MTKAHLGWWAGERYWQCTQHVYSGDRSDFRGHQCGKTATKDHDAEGNPTKCGIHSAEAIAKRNAKGKAKLDATMAKWNRDHKRGLLKTEAAEIVRRIADGHNDARGLCEEWLARWEQNENAT